MDRITSGFNESTHPVLIVARGKERRPVLRRLMGVAREHGLDPRHVRHADGGYRITEALNRILHPPTAEEPVEEPVEEPEVEEIEDDAFDPADYTVAQVKDFATANPDLLEDLLESEESGKNRQSLVEWLRNQIALQD